MILIKYGELTTKKANRRTFIDKLENNIKAKLGNIDYKIKRTNVRMFIETHEEDKTIEILKDIFGIHSICKVINSDLDLNNIKTIALKLLQNKKFTTFKVETNRANKEYELNSLEISREVGAHILKNIKDIKVNVKNPEVLLKVEVRATDSYIYIDEEYGLGGYPVGIAGKGLLMLSGGIDSPVAGYLAMKRGIELNCIYFEALPHTSLNAREKVITLAKKLSNYGGNIKLHVVPFTAIQESIYKNIEKTYLITIMRRMMYRISEIIARKNKCKIIINGESIGQVASQTLSSINSINEVTSFPIIRPVACFDKLEIIEIAKAIDTYETSILPYEDCCTVFVPKHPVINPKLEKAIEYEKLINYEEMIKTAVENTNTILITNSIEKNNLL